MSVSNLALFFILNLVFLSFIVTYPIMLMINFMLITGLCVYYMHYNLNDFWSYMLFLVYVGGLLVLVIYMIMISSNQLMSLPKYSVLCTFNFCLVFFLLFGYMMGDMGYSMKVSSPVMLVLNSNMLLILGSLLFFMFLGICSMLKLGGRSLSLGANK